MPLRHHADPTEKEVRLAIRQRAQTNQIGAEVNGEAVVDLGVDSEEEVRWDQQDLQEAALEAEEVVEVAVTLRVLIHWLAIDAGCMAIWPVIVPKPEQRRREVVMLALPNVNSLNPGKKAQEDEVEVGLFDSGVSMSCMTRLGMNTQWTMWVNCTSPSDLNLL